MNISNMSRVMTRSNISAPIKNGLWNNFTRRCSRISMCPGMESDSRCCSDIFPLFAVTDYDGYWIHAYGEIRNSDGELESKPLWHAKKPYAHADALGNSVSFTLDDYVHAFDATTDRWYEGKRECVNEATGQRIPLLADAGQFEQVRRTTIVNTLQRILAHYINSHNTHARKLGSRIRLHFHWSGRRLEQYG